VPSTDTIAGAVFGHAGSELFVSFGQTGSIARGDLNALPQSWTLPVFVPSWKFSGLEIDRHHDLLYASKPTGGIVTAQPALVAIDVNPSSPSYGAIAGTSSPTLDNYVNGWIGTWTLSSSGKLAAFCGANSQGQNLVLVDCDPTSATWLQVTVGVLIPASTFNSPPTRIRISNDDQDVFILKPSLPGAGYELARYRVATASWVDFNPAAGIQHLGYFSAPSVPLGPDFDLSSNGGFAIAWGHTFGSIACDLLTRIDFNPASPASINPVTWNLASGVAALTLDLSEDDAVVALASEPIPSCPAAQSTIVQVDAATGAVLGISPPLPTPPSGAFSSWIVRFN
jgi:hypothetical protein